MESTIALGTYVSDRARRCLRAASDLFQPDLSGGLIGAVSPSHFSYSFASGLVAPETRPLRPVLPVPWPSTVPPILPLHQKAHWLSIHQSPDEVFSSAAALHSVTH
jgi:hypothetical protein